MATSVGSRSSSQEDNSCISGRCWTRNSPLRIHKKHDGLLTAEQGEISRCASRYSVASLSYGAKERKEEGSQVLLRFSSSLFLILCFTSACVAPHELRLSGISMSGKSPLGNADVRGERGLVIHVHRGRPLALVSYACRAPLVGTCFATLHHFKFTVTAKHKKNGGNSLCKIWPNDQPDPTFFFISLSESEDGRSLYTAR